VLLVTLAAAPVLRAEEQVIYPRTAAAPTAPAPRPPDTLSPLMLVLAFGAAAAGGWLLWRQRRQGQGLAGAARKLAVTETRSLGSRQYLVVADYDGRKFLLGVCPGRIELLAPLDGEKQ
jgi:flagellar protein FliO/FliZ